MIATQPGCSKGKKQKLILFFSFPPLCSLPQRLLVLAHALCPPPKLVFLRHFFHANGELVRAELNLHVIVPFRKDFYNFPKQCPSILEHLQKLLIRKLFRIHFLSTLSMNNTVKQIFSSRRWNHNFHGIQLKIFVFIGSKNIWKLSKLWQFGHLHSSKHLQMSSENAFFNTV